jgi:hypothetical protein
VQAEFGGARATASLHQVIDRDIESGVPRWPSIELESPGSRWVSLMPL